MEQFISNGPTQLIEAVDVVRRLPGAPKPHGAVLLGMGGSALGGGLVDLLRLTQGCGWPWQVVRDYRLHCPVGPQTRVFSLSYSGNTEEVLATLERALPMGGYHLAVSSGGLLQERALSAGIPWVQVPAQAEGFQPRFALYFMFGVLHEMLIKDGLLARQADLGAIAERLLAGDLAPEGRDIAGFIGDRIPVVYTDTFFDAGVARTWRIKFNENSKIPALSGALPEINHNELIAFGPEYSSRFAFLLMPDPDGPERISHRFTLLARLLSGKGYPVLSVPLVGANPVEKALRSLQLADWVSLFVARNRGVDPVSIPAIQDFKKLL
jgi:glucose/mannose-6-phosphate isomerase